MYSMNRSSRPCSRANRASGTTSSSVQPLIATALIFTGSNPASFAARIPSITCSNPVLRVNCWNRSGSMRVEADVDPSQARIPERTGQRCQENPVGRQPDILDPRNRGDLLDQAGKIPAHQRLAPREPDLVDSQGHDDPDEPLDLLEAEKLLPRQKLRILGHAVDAADVAAVGDADPQVVVHPAKRVDQWCHVSSHSLDRTGVEAGFDDRHPILSSRLAPCTAGALFPLLRLEGPSGRCERVS